MESENNKWSFSDDNGLEGYEAQLDDVRLAFAIKYMDCERVPYRGHNRISEEELNATNRHDRRAAECKQKKALKRKKQF
jgi:hypothetical protein